MRNGEFLVPKYNSLVFEPANGKLFYFQGKRIEMIRLGDPYPIACRKTEENPLWVNFIPFSRFPFLFGKPNKRLFESEPEQYRRFYEHRIKTYDSIMHWVGRENFRAVNRFKSRQWLIYYLLRLDKSYSKDFIEINPALSFLIASHAVFHPLKNKNYWRSARSLILKKRRKIADYFGFPGTESMVKIFSKIKPQMSNIATFLWLRKVLEEKPYLLRDLTFLKKINIGSMSIFLSEFKNEVGFSLIEEVSLNVEEKKRPYTFYYLKDISRMLPLLINNDIYFQVPNLKSMEQVKRVHDHMVFLVNELQNVKDIVFDKCELQDIEKDHIHIEIIKDSKELHREGYKMHHCIYSYNDEIIKGGCIAARMLIPERLTILFKKVGLYYRLIDIRGFCNSNPKKKSVSLIRKWLKGGTTFYDEGSQFKLFSEFYFDDDEDVKVQNELELIHDEPYTAYR